MTMQEWYIHGVGNNVLFREVSSVHECLLIERFHCMYRVSNLEEWRGRSECDLHEVMPPLLQSVQPQSTLWTHPILTHPHPLWVWWIRYDVIIT